VAPAFEGMVSQQLAPSVVAFLTEHIASVHELELLMLLALSGGRWWDAAAGGRELGIPVKRARAALDALAARNLLDMRITDDVHYQFRPGTSELQDSALAVAEAYKRSPAAVVQVVVRTAPRSIRDFADAFRMRRRDR